MAGINLDADLGVRGFLKGTKDMEEALQDVSDELETTAKEGDKGLEKLSDKLLEAKKAADNAAKSGENLGKDFKKGTDKASEGTDDLKQNAQSNAKEVTASFDGSVESIIDGFQGLASEAFEGFGAAGAIAGFALAAGIGIATAEFQKSEEAAKKAKERIADLGQAMIDAGAEGVKPLDTVIESLQQIVTNSEDAVKKFQDIAKASKFVGTQAEDMALAYAGQADALEGQLDVIEDLIKKEQKQADKQAEHGSRFAVVGEAKVNTLKQQQEELKKVQEETEAAAAIEEAYLAAGGAEAQAKADAIGVINAAYDDAVYSVDNFKNAETGIYDLDAYAASIEERARLLEEYQSNLAKSGLTTEQKAALNEMGVEQANAILKGLQDPNTSQATKDTITKGLKIASQEGSGVAKKEIEDAFKKPVEAKINVKAETAVAQADLDNLVKARTAIIKVDYRDRYGNKVY